MQKARAPGWQKSLLATWMLYSKRNVVHEAKTSRAHLGHLYCDISDLKSNKNKGRQMQTRRKKRKKKTECTNTVPPDDFTKVRLNDDVTTKSGRHRRRRKVKLKTAFQARLSFGTWSVERANIRRSSCRNFNVLPTFKHRPPRCRLSNFEVAIMWPATWFLKKWPTIFWRSITKRIFKWADESLALF